MLGPRVSNFKKDGNPKIGGNEVKFKKKKKDFIFGAILDLQKIKGKRTDMPTTPTSQFLLLLTSCIRVVHLFQLINIETLLLTKVHSVH